MKINEIIQYVSTCLDNNIEELDIIVSVNCLDDLDIEEAVYTSMLALFRRNLKQELLVTIKGVSITGTPKNLLRVLEKPANARFFEHVTFAENLKIESTL